MAETVVLPCTGFLTNLEHTSASQVKDPGAYGVVVKRLLEQYRAGNYGTSLHEAEGSKCVGWFRVVDEGSIDTV